MTQSTAMLMVFSKIDTEIKTRAEARGTEAGFLTTRSQTIRNKTTRNSINV